MLKMCQWVRRLVWLKIELWLELKHEKKNLRALEEGADNSEGLQGCHEVMQGEN